MVSASSTVEQVQDEQVSDRTSSDIGGPAGDFKTTYTMANVINSNTSDNTLPAAPHAKLNDVFRAHRFVRPSVTLSLVNDNSNNFKDRLIKLEQNVQAIRDQTRTQVHHQPPNWSNSERTDVHPGESMETSTSPRLFLGQSLFDTTENIFFESENRSQILLQGLSPQTNKDPVLPMYSHSKRRCDDIMNPWPKPTNKRTEPGLVLQSISRGTTAKVDLDNTTYDSTPLFKESNVHDQALDWGAEPAIIESHNSTPLVSQIPFLWTVFKKNIDPLLKVLHVPSMDKTIQMIIQNPNSLTPKVEALLFSISYAAISSLEENDVNIYLRNKKAYLITQSRTSIERALAKANFRNTFDLGVLQALTIYLVIAHRHEDIRCPWALTSLLIRVNQILGIYTNPKSTGLSPFGTEMGRRLWWVVSTMDLSYAEHDGTQAVITDRSVSPDYPSNINDINLFPEMESFPRAIYGGTDTTLCLVQYQLCSLAKRISMDNGMVGKILRPPPDALRLQCA
ncbi:hypothetical protein TruAng_002378 [Truncatella angustata]|nr:hypothetical protein TruAng_002378 [Truncatella angustata]